MSLLHTMLNFWLISWFKLMDIFNTWLISWFKLMDVFNTLVYLYKFLFNLSLLLFVPLLCSTVLVVLSCITLSSLTLVP